MKTLCILVRRMCVAYHLPHPEPYGESVVVLVNGMWTDVYTNKNNQLYTPTNNTALIRYLRRVHQADPFETYTSRSLSLTTATAQAIGTLAQFTNFLRLYPERPDDSNEAARLIISHALTAYQHLYVLRLDGEAIGVLQRQTQPSLVLFELVLEIQNERVKSALRQHFKALISLIKKAHPNDLFYARVPEDQPTVKALWVDAGFVSSEKTITFKQGWFPTVKCLHCTSNVSR